MNAENNNEISLCENEISLCIEYTNIGIITITTGSELKAVLIIMLSQWCGPFDYNGKYLFEKHNVNEQEFEEKILKMSTSDFNNLLDYLKVSIMIESYFMFPDQDWDV